jgi:hypothetical protein
VAWLVALYAKSMWNTARCVDNCLRPGLNTLVAKLELVASALHDEDFVLARMDVQRHISTGLHRQLQQSARTTGIGLSENEAHLTVANCSALTFTLI